MSSIFLPELTGVPQPESGCDGGRLRSEEPSELPESGKRASFSRRMRLLRHSDFERVYKQGRRHFAAHLTMFYLGRAEGAELRVGFTVSKALGNAVERNRIRRRLREAVRLHWPPEKPIDVVINPKKSALTVDFPQLEKEVVRAFEVIGKS